MEVSDQGWDAAGILPEVQRSAMTDAGEKLAERIAKFSPQHALCEYEENGLCEHCAAELVRDELERAAGIADRLDQVEGGRIAAAIRKLKE